MEGKDLNKKEHQTPANKKLEWGAHNPKLTESNFIDRRHKKISDQNELLANVAAPLKGQEKEK